MPVVGDTQVIVEAVDDSYDRLHDGFASQSGTSVPGPNAAVRVETPPKGL